MSLVVHLHGAPIGELTQGTGTDYHFRYLPETVVQASEGAIVLSNSLPVREEPFDAIATRTYFDGLLPEDTRRDGLSPGDGDARPCLRGIGKPARPG